MQFSEDDLRRALRRKMPGPDFTQRVLARIEQDESKPVQPKLAGAKRTDFSLRLWPKRVMAIASFAAMLAVAVGLLQYERYENHVRQENARKQAVLALQITSATLNQALHRALVRPEKLQ
jgi:hypothetical protein